MPMRFEHPPCWKLEWVLAAQLLSARSAVAEALAGLGLSPNSRSFIVTLGLQQFLTPSGSHSSAAKVQTKEKGSRRLPAAATNIHPCTGIIKSCILQNCGSKPAPQSLMTLHR
jgi:hypothetical protein